MWSLSGTCDDICGVYLVRVMIYVEFVLYIWCYMWRLSGTCDDICGVCLVHVMIYVEFVLYM